MKALFAGLVALAASALVSPLAAASLPQAALQLASPDISVTGVAVDFSGGVLDIDGTALFLDNTLQLFGNFHVTVNGLQPDLSFASGSLSVLDNVSGDGDQSLFSASLIAIGTDNSQVQLLFGALTGGAAWQYLATSPYALVLVNGFVGVPSFSVNFSDTIGNNADIAAVDTDEPGPAMLLATLGATAAIGLVARRRRV
jgi:hypothetical protein